MIPIYIINNLKISSAMVLILDCSLEHVESRVKELWSSLNRVSNISHCRCTQMHNIDQTIECTAVVRTVFYTTILYKYHAERGIMIERRVRENLCSGPEPSLFKILNIILTNLNPAPLCHLMLCLLPSLPIIIPSLYLS